MIAGVDPGLGHTGFAVLDRAGELLEAGVLVTEAVVLARGDKGRKLAPADEQRRVAQLGAGLRPVLQRCALVALEWPPSAFGEASAGRPASPAAATTGKVAAMVAGMAWGMGRSVWAVASVTWRSKLGYRSGREAELHGAMFHRYGAQLGHVPRRLLPHVLDAIGVARARLEIAD